MHFVSLTWSILFSKVDDLSQVSNVLSSFSHCQVLPADIENIFVGTGLLQKLGLFTVRYQFLS